MDFALIVDHPDYEEIVTKIVSGVNVKDISQWLKVKYNDKEQRHLQLSATLLQDFVNKHVDLESQLRNDILAKKTGNLGLTDHKIANSLQNNKTYQERVLELASEEIDLKKLVAELVLTCKARMEQVFDRIQENPSNQKGDYVLIKYFETLFIAVEKFNKIVNDAPDQVIQHNITIQAIEQHTAIFQEAIRETLALIDAESALLFIEILTDKMRAMKAPIQVVAPVEERTAEAKLLRESIVPMLEK